MKLSKILLGAVLLFFTIYYFVGVKQSPFNIILFDACSVCVVAAVSIFLSHSQKGGGKGYWLKPSYLFVLGYLAVNFQYLLDLRLGLKTLASRRFLYPDIFNHCLVLGVIGLLAFVIGYSYRPLPLRVETDDYNSSSAIGTRKSVPVLLQVLHLLVFAWFLFSADINSIVSGASYDQSAVSGPSTATRAESLLFVMNALVILFASMRSIGKEKFSAFIAYFPFLSLAIIVVYLFIRLVSGDRGPFIYTSLLIIFGYLFASRKKIKLGIVAVALLGATLLMSLIGIARSLDVTIPFVERITGAADQFSTEGRFALEDGSVFNLTDELGISFIANQVDVEAIEVKNEPYHYFAYPVYGLLSGIPFVPGIIQGTFGVTSDQFSSSGYADYQFFGGYDRTYGIGTTILGDFYLSFGVFGVILGLFLTGLFLRFLDVTIFIRDRKNITYTLLLLVLLFASKTIYMPRATLYVEIPRFVWGVIILFALSLTSGGSRAYK